MPVAKYATPARFCDVILQSCPRENKPAYASVLRGYAQPATPMIPGVFVLEKYSFPDGWLMNRTLLHSSLFCAEPSSYCLQ